MTLTEALEELKAMIEQCTYERGRQALAMAWNALEAMKNIKEAESIEYVAEILKEYISEVEV